MNRGAIVLILLLLFGVGAVYAQSADEDADFPADTLSSPETDAVTEPETDGEAETGMAVETDAAAEPELEAAPAAEEIPGSLRNNKFYLESVRLTALAQKAYEGGDYDASSGYAEEALRYAFLSDEYVALQLKIRETDQAISAAQSRLAWAASVDVPRRFPGEYGRAEAEYDNARNARGREEWDEAIAAARRVLVVLADILGLPEGNVLPARYTVRAWNLSKDCLWNIAGRPWAYGDPEKWRLIYNANRSKLSNPDNPNIIEPGMVLDIPSIKGETRQGMWEAGRTYPALP